MNLKLGRAWSILMQTKTYLVYRAAVYGALAAGVLVYLGFLGLIGAIFGGGAAVVLFLVTLVGGSMLGLGQLAGEYLLYMLKAGHVALVTEIIEKGRLPPGVSQTSWAQGRVLGLVKEVSVLALVDQFVRGIIRFIHREVLGLSALLPIRGLEGAAQGVSRIIQLSLTFVDESMLAYAFKTENPNVFEASKTGIILYCQCWEGILKNAVVLAVVGYVLTALLFLAFAMPFGAIALLLPTQWATVRFALFMVALLLAVSVKMVLYNPLACTATILTFFEESKGMEPSHEWEARLADASEKFRELQAKAVAFVAETTHDVATHPAAKATPAAG
jgi:hypothetical protein